MVSTTSGSVSDPSARTRGKETHGLVAATKSVSAVIGGECDISDDDELADVVEQAATGISAVFGRAVVGGKRKFGEDAADDEQRPADTKKRARVTTVATSRKQLEVEAGSGSADGTDQASSPVSGAIVSAAVAKKRKEAEDVQRPDSAKKKARVTAVSAAREQPAPGGRSNDEHQATVSTTAVDIAPVKIAKKRAPAAKSKTRATTAPAAGDDDEEDVESATATDPAPVKITKKRAPAAKSKTRATTAPAAGDDDEEDVESATAAAKSKTRATTAPAAGDDDEEDVESATATDPAPVKITKKRAPAAKSKTRATTAPAAGDDDEEDVESATAAAKSKTRATTAPAAGDDDEEDVESATATDPAPVKITKKRAPAAKSKTRATTAPAAGDDDEEDVESATAADPAPVKITKKRAPAAKSKTRATTAPAAGDDDEEDVESTTATDPAPVKITKKRAPAAKSKEEVVTAAPTAEIQARTRGDATATKGGKSKQTIRDLIAAPASDWNLQARVIARSCVCTWTGVWGDGKKIDLLLADKNGDAIKAAIFSKGVDAFDALINSGATYDFSGGRMKKTNAQYSTDKFELTFDERAVIRASSGVPQASLPCTDIEHVANSPTGSKVSIIGVVAMIGGLKTMTTKKNTVCSKREILVVDSTMKKIVCTRWGKQAEEEMIGYEGKVVLVKQAELKEYEGMRSLNVGPSSSMWFDPEVAETAATVEWYSEGHDLSSFSFI